MDLSYDREQTARAYDEYGEQEWDRHERAPFHRVAFHLHRHYLTQFIHHGDRVLEAGAGSGRFTVELARLGATVVVTSNTLNGCRGRRTVLLKTAVLRSFSERSGVPDVSSFVTVMIQSQTFGTSIAEALRVYAAEMRDKRVMRAEEKANKLPTKMTLGTMMFTVPPLLIILVGPSVYDMLNLFATMKFYAMHPALRRLPFRCPDDGRLRSRRRPSALKGPPYAPPARASSGEAVDGLTRRAPADAGGRARTGAAGLLSAPPPTRAWASDVISAIGSTDLALGRLGQAEQHAAPGHRDRPDLCPGLEQPWCCPDGKRRGRRSEPRLRDCLCAG